MPKRQSEGAAKVGRCMTIHARPLLLFAVHLHADLSHLDRVVVGSTICKMKSDAIEDRSVYFW